MLKKWKLMEQAGEGGDPGAGAPEAGAPAAGAAPAEGTVLSAGAAPAAPAGIPEKYQVKLEDGSIDQAASVAKLAEAYAHAEKRIGSGDLPPKSAAEYEVTVPEALAGAWDPATDPLLSAFQEKAFAAGMTQAQFDLVINQFGQIAPGLVMGSAQASFEDCAAELEQEWTTDAEFDQGVLKAQAAVKAYGGQDAEAILTKYGNDAALIRLLSRVGRELPEDKSLNPDQVLGGDTIEALLASKAYTDPKDPQHAAVSAKVRAFYDAQNEKNERAGIRPIGL